MRGAAGTGLLGLALLLAAALLDAAPLYAPGAGLVALAIGAAAWVALAARGAGVERSALPRRLMEEEPLEVVLHVRAGTLPPPGGLVRDPLAPEGLPLPPRGAGRLRLSVTFARRGPRHLVAPELALRDPLGLVETRCVSPAAPDDVLVLPRIEPIRAAGGGARGPGDVVALIGVATAVEVEGLRPYREGAPASRIHWPALARGRGLVERRLAGESVA